MTVYSGPVFEMATNQFNVIANHLEIPMFDPALKGYWGTVDLDRAMDAALAIINANAAKVDGVKVSLLDKQREIDMRRRLDKHVKMYTGDDFNYAELIAGDEQGFSHASTSNRQPRSCHGARVRA